MHRIGARTAGLIVLVAVAGCAGRVQDPGAFRTPETGIYSNAVLQNDRLAGQWVQIAEFAASGAADCTQGALDVQSATPEKLSLVASLCFGGRIVDFAGDAVTSGPGRFRLSGEREFSREWWILWVDDGYRTLVVGTPTGSFGMILNRDADLPADRMQAARDVLRWNGYDLTKLRTTGQG